MRQDNRDLLEDVMTSRLSEAIDGENEDVRSTAFKDGMNAADRLIALGKNDDAFQEHEEKLAFEREKLDQEKEKLAYERQKLEQERLFQEAQLIEAKKKEKWARWIGLGGTVLTGVASIVLPMVLDKSDKKFKKEFANDCFKYETEGVIPTSTPTKSTRDFLRHK